MISTLFGVAVGIIVCVFGIWSYTKGENNGQRLARHEPVIPPQPLEAVKEAVKEAVPKKDSAKNPIGAQISNIMRYNAELPTDKEGD